MELNVTRRLSWLLWIATLTLFLADWMVPISSTATRIGGTVLLSLVWFGLIAICWRRLSVRISLLGFTLLAALFLLLPGRKNRNPVLLRDAYVAGMRHYDGVTYSWGGESPKGIDCSGLIRRGLIDSFFMQGLRSLDAGLIRHSIWIWWHDCTAAELGEAHRYTTHVLNTPSIKELDHSKIVMGDLAVTSGGAHIMAYTGDNQWIEADPDLGKVISISASSKESPWARLPMTIVRWNSLR